MKRKQRFTLTLVALCVAGQGMAQVQVDGNGNYRLTPTTPGPRNFTIGNTYITGAGSALNVRGDLLGAGNNTGEVFRTDAPTGSTTSWRLFRGGIQYGRLFNLTGANDFNVEATAGQLRLFTNVSTTVPRLRILPVTTGVTINGYTGNVLSGHVGTGSFTSTFVSRPHSILHLDAGGSQDSGYRPWMQSGMTITRQSDQGYFGLKDEGGARNHTVIAWSDNTMSHPGPDLLKFIFVADNTAANGTAGTLNALEAARVAPAGNGNESFFGIGDWFTAGGNVNPDERLDLLDRTIRIRRLLPDYQNNALDVVVVADTTGSLFWRDASTLGGCASGWSLNGNNAVTAFNGNPCPPQTADFVGIGLNNPIAKLDVLKDGPTSSFDIGQRLRVATTSPFKAGLDLSILTPGSVSWGYRAKVGGALHNYGMDISAENGASPGQVIGGRFMAVGGGIAANDDLRGITTASSGAAGGGPGWAIWADGKAFLSSGTLWSTSDEQLKQNIQDLDRAETLQKLLAIETKSYSFNAEQYGFMGLEDGVQRGVLSQQLEQVLPDLVRDMHRSGSLNEEGNTVEADVDFKAVNYLGLIPVMIASIQAQQEIIEAQNTRLDAMQATLSTCCSAPATGQRIQQLDQDNAMSTNGCMLQIVPNPFSEPPTVHYTLDRGGRMQLQVNTADGPEFRVLKEATLEAGSYQYIWDTSSLVPGVYYVTMLLDALPVVQKAVKVMR